MAPGSFGYSRFKKPLANFAKSGSMDTFDDILWLIGGEAEFAHLNNSEVFDLAFDLFISSSSNACVSFIDDMLSAWSASSATRLRCADVVAFRRDVEFVRSLRDLRLLFVGADAVIDERKRLGDAAREAAENVLRASYEARKRLGLFDDGEMATPDQLHTSKTLPSESDCPTFGGEDDCWLKLSRTQLQKFEGEPRKTAAEIYTWLKDLVETQQDGLVERQWCECDLNTRFVKVSHVRDNVFHLECSTTVCPCNEPTHWLTTEGSFKGRDIFATTMARYPEGHKKRAKVLDNFRKSFGWAAVGDPRPEGWITLGEFFDKYLVTPEAEFGNAMEALQEAYRINMSEMAKIGALDLFNNEMAALPKTDVLVRLNELPGLIKYLGSPVLSTMKKESRNDHKYLEVAREIVRSRLDSLFPHNTDYNSVLHVGSTMTEVRRWLSHSGHDFQFALKEDKDVARTYEDLNRAIGAKLAKLTVPRLTSRKGNSTRMKLDTLSDGINLLTGDTHKRIYMPGEKIPQHDVLFFEDCLYSIEQEEFAHYWSQQQAKVGYATMFFPNQMVAPDSCPSKIYRYKESYVPLEKFRAMIKQFWPEVLAVTAFVPSEFVNGYVRSFFETLSHRGWSLFCDWMRALSSDDYPLELALENIGDIIKFKKIFMSLFRRLKPLFRRLFCNIQVTWMGGFSNGYEHPARTWEAWLRNPRIQLPSGEFVDSEIVDRVGEMYLIRFWTSSGQSDIVRNVSLPVTQRTVMVADLETAYSVTSKQLGDLTYFPMLEAEWLEIVNWGLSEPVESLTVASMMHTVRRIRGGLSIGSNVLVEAMDFDVAMTSKISLAALMYVFQRADVLNMIAADEELSKGYTLRITDMLVQIGKFGLALATGGLAYGIWYIFKWLTESHPNYEFCKWIAEPEPKVVHGKKSMGAEVSPESIAQRTMTLCMPHKELKSKNVCLLCEMQKAGAFSQTGVASEGQEFECSNHGMDNNVEIGFRGSEIVSIISKLRDAKNAHVAMGATKLAPLIGKVEHYFEAQEGGLDYTAKVHSIRGGPGTGKTEVIKALMRHFERSNVRSVATMPFKELVSDYSQTTVLGEGTKKFTFDADTTWYTARHQNVQVLICDEMTGMDWMQIRAMAIYIGAKEIYLVGDRMQTKLNSAASEGIDPTNPESGLDWALIPEHDLIWNYRLDAWRVKLLNHLYGYKMQAKRTDKLPPKFITRAEYEEMKKLPGQRPEKELVFAHAAANPVFGCDSEAGNDEVPNMSVRSAQGKTHKTTAVSASILDKGLISTHGMVCVAVSRAKGQVYFVTPNSVEDEVPKDLARMLWVDTEDRVKAIDASDWPERTKISDEFTLTEEERRVDKFIADRQAVQELVASDAPENEVDFMYTRLIPSQSEPINLAEPSPVPESDQYDLEQYYLETFSTCYFDAMIEIFGFEAVRPVRMQFLNNIYWDDEAMGRAKRAGSVSGASFQKPLVWNESKILLPLNYMRSFCESKLGAVAIYTNALSVVPAFISAKARKDATVDELPAVLVDKHHVTVRTPRRVRVKFSNSSEISLVSPVKKFKGEFICYTHTPVDVEKAAEGGKGYLRMDVGDATPTPVFGPMPNIPIFPPPPEPVRSYPNQPAPVAALLAVPQFEVTAPAPTAAFLLVAPRPETIHDVIESPAALLAVGNVGHIFGSAPSVQRTSPTGMDREAERVVFRRVSPLSSWKSTPVVLKDEPVIKTPLRLGMNAVGLATFIDPSQAWTRTDAINEAYGVHGPKGGNRMKVNWQGFWHQRTKGGKIRPYADKTYRAIAPGLANHFNNNPEENLIAADRLGKIQAKPKLNAETIAWANRVAWDVFNDLWLPNYRLDELRYNYMIQEAVKACRVKNYIKRGAAETKKTLGAYRLVASNKDQEKVIKDGKLDVTKGGQVILQSPPQVNAEWIAWMRLRGAHCKEAAKPHLFIDDYEDPGEFRKRLCRAIRAAPQGAKVGIMDFVEYDSQQGPVTLQIEKELARLMGNTNKDIADYYDIRGNISFFMFGLFAGKTNGEKGSGFLDTKLGNTLLSTALAHQVFRGKGEKVIAAKGDDHLRVQTGLEIHEPARALIKAHTGMTFKCEIGNGGEFCGNSVSRAGVYPSITRTAMKALCKRARDYKTFCEHQKALRNTVKEWRNCGLKETVYFSAHAEKASPNYVQACLEFVNSLSHIDEKQWLSYTKVRKNTRFQLPAARGCVLY